jgi:gamma-glutamyl phosphate reductase
MILSLKQLASQDDPIGQVLFLPTTTAWRSVIKQLLWDYLIIYESRPDVTVEAGGIAFKSGKLKIFTESSYWVGHVDDWRLAFEKTETSEI